MAQPIKSEFKKEGTLQAIKVEVAGRTYPVLIQPSEEKEIRTIVEEINTKIYFFQEKYPKNDLQDAVAMAYLAFAAQVNNEKNYFTPANEAELNARLEALNSITEKAINK